MTENHPITPPPELIRKWNEEAATAPMADQRYIAIQAARWGADQELKACCDWMSNRSSLTEQLRTARRPKPPSLKEQALKALTKIEDNEATYLDTSVIRHALEALDD